MGSFQNKRNFTRVEYSEGASIRYGDCIVFGRIQDLSLCGFFICTDTEDEIPSNQPVQVTVYQSADRSFKLNAQAVHCEANGIGFQICAIDVNSFGSLRNIIEDRCGNQSQIMNETYKMLGKIKDISDQTH